MDLKNLPITARGLLCREYTRGATNHFQYVPKNEK